MPSNLVLALQFLLIQMTVATTPEHVAMDNEETKPGIFIGLVPPPRSPPRPPPTRNSSTPAPDDRREKPSGLPADLLIRKTMADLRKAEWTVVSPSLPSSPESSHSSTTGEVRLDVDCPTCNGTAPWVLIWLLPPPLAPPRPPPVNPVPKPDVFTEGRKTSGFPEGFLKRRNVTDLTKAEIVSLQKHLRRLQNDHSARGFQSLVAGYHGQPSRCQNEAGRQVACAHRGVPTFPLWHRLYATHLEQALVRHGLLGVGLPYWDWTGPDQRLPALVQNSIFLDPDTGFGQRNAWFSGDVDIGDFHARTSRAVEEGLYERLPLGGKAKLFHRVLDALEEDDFCQFEVQLEIAQNYIHYLVGGRHPFSMSSLDFTSYDPLFFLHLSNVDRLVVAWQELQKRRNRPYARAHCSVEMFGQRLHPFDWASNPVELTRAYSRAQDVFNYLQLGYIYDDLSINGMPLADLYHFLEQRKARERAFAVFSLRGHGFSFVVRVQVCVDDNDDELGMTQNPADEHFNRYCEPAGDFFVLGGTSERPWEYLVPFRFDVTEAVQRLGLPLDGRYHVAYEVLSVNGTSFGGSLFLPQPYGGAYRPALGHADLLPFKCPHPDAAVRYACCVHGRATFPHWHRLFVVKVEEELRKRGADIGVPYWDWTKPGTTVPALASDLTYADPDTGTQLHNPFHHASIDFHGQRTRRQVRQSELSMTPAYGDHTDLFDGVLLAMEQTDFCDFEVQLEITHNAPHILVGGNSSYSMATLHYSAFDPLFYLHHSNVDRLWAIWQQLQILRGLPYKAHCASTLTQQILRPFGFPPPWNNDDGDGKISTNARPNNVYDYERALDYRYDTLRLGGMTVGHLQRYTQQRQARDRTFVGIRLHSIGVSAWVAVAVTPDIEGGEPYLAGNFAVLGGDREKPWRLDRLYKVEITDALSALGLRYDDAFHVSLDIVDVTGRRWPERTFSHSTILHRPASNRTQDGVRASFSSGEQVRGDVTSLSRDQIQQFRDAMGRWQEDESTRGFNHTAAFHGQPCWCISADAAEAENTTYAACGAHGTSVFLHWHRLMTVQAENALRAKGLWHGLPYWDWSVPMRHLPEVVADEVYIHPSTGQTVPNPLHDGPVKDHRTTRDVGNRLFQRPALGELTGMAEKVMLAFEQTDFCDFQVQLEVAQNEVHVLIGGTQTYSMASLRYTAFDPLFFLHHSNTDRLWAIWQALQEYRGLPYSTANCAIASMRKPLQPFAQTSAVNPDPVTRDHATPFDVFDYQRSFRYRYDSLRFNGLSVSQLHREIVKREARERVFAGFMLHGVGQSVTVVLELCRPRGQCREAGRFYLLGCEVEQPWSYDRLFRYDITERLEEFQLYPLDRYDLRYEVFSLRGDSLSRRVFGEPTVVYSAGHKGSKRYVTAADPASSRVRRNLADLTVGETDSLRSALLAMDQDGSFETIAKFYGYPGLCRHDEHPAACCVHGSPTFLHWHRLFVDHVDRALLARGSAAALPYWDWTRPVRQLPDLVHRAIYFQARTQSMETNPFFRWKVPASTDTTRHTTRDPRPDLFNNTRYLLDSVLLALEQTSFCDFEIQLEIVQNAVLSWVGGRGEYSMSSLDYSAFDPLFFLHQANVDRIWAIWQALQRHRGLNHEESDCALNVMRIPLPGFDDKAENHLPVSHRYTRPVHVFDYAAHLGYQYDNLLFNSWTVSQLEEVLKQRRSRDRLFAGFLLHNIGTSADVEINLCVAAGNGRRSCGHSAGKFSLLGGKFEKPYTFDRLYKHDISEAVRKLGLRLDSTADFDLDVRVKSVNGSYLSPRFIGRPSIIFQPGAGKRQDDQGHSEGRLTRKDVRTLSSTERRSLVLALRSLQADRSPDGFQSLASFHALPPLCPDPSAAHRFACCAHGQATFPQWHRLYVVQFEDALRRRGALVGIPYLDSTEPIFELPSLLSDERWHDPLFNTDFPNPWVGGHIESERVNTARDLQSDRLADAGPSGYDTWSWKQHVFALEQEDFCDFEVQLEVAHNALHAWLGGREPYSMSGLHFASNDPAFFLHHAHTDRVLALWQQLQAIRGYDPNEVNCALDLLREPLKPFSFGAPYNLNALTAQYSRPVDVMEYRAHFGYEYDTLQLGGMGVDRLHAYINQRKEKDRVFAGFLLQSIGTSAHIEFSICPSENDSSCAEAGDFYLLGGSSEMPWRFDRLYKYEITDVLVKERIDVRDPFDFKVKITAVNGTLLASDVLPKPTVIWEPKSRDARLRDVAPYRVRRELRRLSERDVMSLKAAMLDLQRDEGEGGYQSLAAYHGAPGMCPSPESPEHACGVHGTPTFLHWHRLYAVQMDHALLRHGSSAALPYWDWTLAAGRLPDLFTTETFYDAWRDEVQDNPFARGYVASAQGFTVRDPRPELLTELSKDGDHHALFDQVLLALEQTDYCDFEVQLEVIHNAVHYLVGGRQFFSLSTLDYSSYDPVFFVHHAFVDKIWLVWQELQKRRGLRHDRADCAVTLMKEKHLHPFDWEEYNPDVVTRAHALPKAVFRLEDLGYRYDDLELGGKTLEELEPLIREQQSRPRVMAGFHLRSLGASADVTFHVCKAQHDCLRAGSVFILGGSQEVPWTFDRLFKYDITDTLRGFDIYPDDVFSDQTYFTIQYDILAVNGSELPASTVSPPSIMFYPARGAPQDRTQYTTVGVGVRKEINTLTSEEAENLREALAKIKNGAGPLTFDQLAAWHGWPGTCGRDGHPVACCHHGVTSFPQWHRLYVRTLEQVMTYQGARLGIPYWDWTEAFAELPSLVTREEDNPFHHGTIEALHQTTSRDPRPQLFTDPQQHNQETGLYNQVLLAFEQRDYCDFEVQLEVAHNSVHSWIGGSSPYGLSSLEYASYDPLFFILHSNLDRQFAIWQELQKFRGLDYNTANCNIQELLLPLEPFNGSNNPVITTKDHAHAIDAFDYERLGYTYDSIHFHGMTVPKLNAVLEHRRNEYRVYAGFMLHNIGTSADVTFDLCDATDGHCQFAGTFAILGGPLEMPWRFDRLFKYDVTSVFRQLRLRPDSEYHFRVHIIAVNGTELDGNLIRPPSVNFVPGRSKRTESHEDPVQSVSKDLTRYEVTSLSLEQTINLRNALYELQNDQGPNGYEAIASFHGAPGLCPEDGGLYRIACCRHGMPAFPHWHRLLTVQFERALRDQGAAVGVPYWDWTRPATALPTLLTASHNNPFKSYHMRFNNKDTDRDVRDELFAHTSENDVRSLFYQTLVTLEETNYCDFEVQYEMLHNAVHGLVGGSQRYSMSTLAYSAFDPFFLVHHASMDRIWVIWQQLQKLRHQPFSFANCAGRSLASPLEPFSYSSVNADPVTRASSMPSQVFDSAKFLYRYDRLDLNGHSVRDLHDLIDSTRKARDRIFAGFLLHGIRRSAHVHVHILSPNGTKIYAGSFHILGGREEMPWAYERPYKLDITDAVLEAGLAHVDTIGLETTVTSYSGQALNIDLPKSLLIRRSAHSEHDVLVVQIGQYEAQNYKVRVKRGTRVRFHSTWSRAKGSLRELGSFTSMQQCVMPLGRASSYRLDVDHALQPGDYFFADSDRTGCLFGHKVMVTVDSE